MTTPTATATVVTTATHDGSPSVVAMLVFRTAFMLLGSIHMIESSRVAGPFVVAPSVHFPILELDASLGLTQSLAPVLPSLLLLSAGILALAAFNLVGRGAVVIATLWYSALVLAERGIYNNHWYLYALLLVLDIATGVLPSRGPLDLLGSRFSLRSMSQNRSPSVRSEIMQQIRARARVESLLFRVQVSMLERAPAQCAN